MAIELKDRRDSVNVINAFCDLIKRRDKVTR
jgi:hypothetical protein